MGEARRGLMNIKVCGITQLKQLQQLEALNIDFAGLIFYEESPRYMKDKLSGKDVKSADFDMKKVGEGLEQPGRFVDTI